MNKRALLAIAFTAGLLSSPSAIFAANKDETTDSVVQKIVSNAQMTPEVRAFYLLKIASVSLAGDSKTNVAAQYAAVANDQDKTYVFMARRWEAFLAPWADQLSLEGCKPAHGSNSVANAILQKAILQLDQSSNKLAKLKMYFIASRLFQKAGNNAGMQQCNKILDEVFHSCEASTPIDEEQTKAAIAVLDSMANGLITVQIPDYNPKSNPAYAKEIAVRPFSDKDFNTCEKLKLRGVAMADRLDTKNHTRRKAHRDLALWYMQLGKTAKAEKEKQILFDMVGFKDDNLLYPQSKGCGEQVWWQKEQKLAVYACGMG